MPADQFRGIRIVEQIDGHRDTFVQADQGAWDAPVISNGADGVILGDIDQDRADPQRDIGRRGIRNSGRLAIGAIAGSQ
jgi:hypothetical protein